MPNAIISPQLLASEQVSNRLNRQTTAGTEHNVKGIPLAEALSTPVDAAMRQVLGVRALGIIGAQIPDKPLQLQRTGVRTVMIFWRPLA